MQTPPLVIEKTYHAPAYKVWEALTVKDKMKQWYFDVDDFKPEVGFEFHFYGENEGRSFFHTCIITAVVVDKKLTHSWEYKNYPGSSVVSFELFEEGDNTRLKLTHTGLETFPADNHDFSIQNFTAGWTHIIGKSLSEYLT